MHHPGRKSRSAPRLDRSVARGFIDSFHRDSIFIPHALNRLLDELPGDSLPAMLFDDVHRVDNTDSPRFDDRWNRLPLVNAANEKPNQTGVMMGDVSNTRRGLVTPRQPLCQSSLTICLKAHIRTCCLATVV